METLFFAIQMKSNNWIAFVENVGISFIWDPFFNHIMLSF